MIVRKPIFQKYKKKEIIMKNYILINGQKIELTTEQARQIAEAYGVHQKQLAEYAVGDTVKIGDHEMVVLEQQGDTTAMIRKYNLPKKMAFGNTNNFIGSKVEKACDAFADQLAAIIGAENIVLHDVDLTSDDGLDDFGKATDRRASLLTTDMYRRYVRILDKQPVKEWWWLATPFSIPPHDSDNWVKCVSPSGFISNSICRNDSNGVRPFCILKSNIFVSK